MTQTLAELATRFAADIQGNTDCHITGVASLKSAKAGQISFFYDKRYINELVATKASAVILCAEYAELSKPEFIKKKLKFKTRRYLTSGGKEYVPDGRPGHHSPFTRKLLEALRSYGGKDKILTVNELIFYIEKVDPQPRYGEFGDNDPGSDFIFIAK